MQTVIMQHIKEELVINDLDNREMNIIVSAVNYSIFQSLVHCKTVKEMWDKLIVHMEGTDEVRKNRSFIPQQQLKFFEQKPKERITETFERFHKIVNNLKTYRVELTICQINNKILRALTLD